MKLIYFVTILFCIHLAFCSGTEITIINTLQQIIVSNKKHSQSRFEFTYTKELFPEEAKFAQILQRAIVNGIFQDTPKKPFSNYAFVVNILTNKTAYSKRVPPYYGKKVSAN